MVNEIKSRIMYYGYQRVKILESYPTFNLVEIETTDSGEKKVVDICSLTKEKVKEKSISLRIL